MGYRTYYQDTTEPTYIFAMPGAVVQDPLSGVILSHAKRFGLLAVCSEPGYCSDSCLREVVTLAARSGMQTFSRDFSKLSSACATDGLVRFVRQVRSKVHSVKVDPFVLIAGLPAADESELTRQGAAIARLVSSGCSVVCTFLPEARQLLEELRGYALLTAEDMSEFPFDGASSDGSVADLTHGIPALSRALAEGSEPGMGHQLGDAYYRELTRLCGLSLRPGLMDDELRIRLAMIILGEGCFDDIARVVGFDPNELLVDDGVWAPFFGVSGMTRMFECLAGASDLWLGEEPGRIDEMAEAFDSVALESLCVLGERGSFTRIARFFCRVPQDVRLKVLEKYGPELIDSGSIGMVKLALASAPSEWRERLSMLQGVCDVLGSERIGARKARCIPDVLPSRDEASMLCAALMGLRAGLRGEGAGLAMLANSPTGLQRRLCGHAEAVELVLAGNFMLAVERLVPLVGDGEPTTLTGHVLAVDMAMARALACGCAWRAPAEARACESFLKQKGYAGLLGHVWACDLVFAVLCGEGAKQTYAAVRTRAAKSGDKLLKSLSLAAEAASLLKGKPSAYIAAAIKAAETSCSSIGWDYGARVMRIMGEAERFCLGERSELRPVEGPDSLSVVSTLVQDVCCDAVGENQSVMSGDGCPRDAMWLLVFLCNGSGEFADALDEQIPVEWRRSLEIVARGCLTVRRGRKMAFPLAGEESLVKPAEEVRINVLGEFSFWAGGRRVSERNLIARDAMRVLEYLALQTGHLSNRLRMAGDLWPEVTDVRKARQKVYSATHVIRKALETHGYDGDALFTNRSNEVVSIQTEVLVCDVDELLECARVAQDGLNDVKACAAAKRAEVLYVGDLYMSASEESGYFTVAKEGLRRTYADTMVAGGEAALRLENHRLAIRLATNALSVDELREDAITLLVRSLRAAGRGSEALNAYEQYERLLFKRTGRQPSRQMKRALNEPTVWVKPAPAYLLPAKAAV